MLQLYAGPLDEQASVEGCRLERSRALGTVEVSAIDPSGERVGVVRLHPGTHGDSFYGRFSRNDDDFVYGSALEISPGARGRGLGQQMLRAARCVAFEESGKGLKSLVAPDNTVSLRCHDVVGFDPPAAELRGVRLGSRVLWLGRSPLER